MGKCAYSGETIDLEELNNSKLYDIDHIYPRSKTKDDSITRNLVLVKAELNREKTNLYPINANIRARMAGIWKKWWLAGLITKEKYERLVRSTPLTNDELGGFIARQLVETSQSVKAIRDLLQRAYPDSEVIMVKAGQVSDFRHLMSANKKDQEGNLIKAGQPEFVKVRELNDFHHAKDAYLNIVVGNVMNSTFTNNPYEWIKRREGREYSIRPELIFRKSLEYQKKDGSTSIYPEVKGWDFADSLKIISDTMKRNDILWTRRSYIESGAISDQQLVPKSEKADGLLKIKQDERLKPERYGGYNKVTGASFAIIDITNSKGDIERHLISVPMIYQNKLQDFVNEKYPGSRIIVSPLKYKALIKVNGIPLYITGKSGDRFAYQHGLQLMISPDNAKTVKAIKKVVEKLKNNKYNIDAEKDGIDESKIALLMDELMNKTSVYSRIPSLEKMIEKIQNSREKFDQLDLAAKCKAIAQLLKLFSCNAEKADLSSFVPAATQAGLIMLGRNIGTLDSALLVNQSPTGLYEEIIDLKTVQPKPQKEKRRK